MELSEDQFRALQAYFQWNLGDQTWADDIQDILESDAPLDTVVVYIDDNSVEWVLDEDEDDD